MELLLLLSALLTGITGVMSGGRPADAPQVEISASVQAAEAAMQVADTHFAQQAPVLAVILSIALVLFLCPLTRWHVASPAYARRNAARFERRLE